MHEQIKEHGRDIKLSRNETSVSEHANETEHYPLRDPQKHCICIPYGLKKDGISSIEILHVIQG